MIRNQEIAIDSGAIFLSQTVSIIMPAYNAEKYIAESIRSVLAQSYSNWELIVINDGSTDKTEEIVRAYASDDRIKYILQRNGGQGKARNKGIKSSTGTLIAFLDSDDLWAENKLELQVRALNEMGVDLVFSDGFFFTGTDSSNERCKFSENYGRFARFGKFSGPQMFDLLLEHNSIPTLSVLARKSLLLEVGLFEEEGITSVKCEDYDLWLRLAKNGAVFYGMQQPLVRYRIHPEASSRKAYEMATAEITVVKKHIHESALDKETIRKRIGVLYEYMLWTLLDEYRMEEAKQCVEDVLMWSLYKRKDVYRNLITALVDNGKFAEATELIDELSNLNKTDVISLLQKGLIRVYPKAYNFISKQILYRTEFHLNRFLSLFR